MKIISLVTQKGGCGKSTLTSNLAVAAYLKKGKILLLDADPQKTLMSWWKDRELSNMECIVVGSNDIEGAIEHANKEKYTHVFIDTPGRAEAINAAAIRAADFCLIPCRPTLADMRAQKTTVEMIEQVNTPAAFVVNQSHSRGSRAVETKKGLALYSLPVSEKVVSYLVAYQDAYSAGKGVLEFDPDGRAAVEIHLLWIWLNNKMEQLT